MALKRELESVSGPASKPCTETLSPQLFPASSATNPPLTLETPGSADTSVSIRLNKSRDCAGLYPFRLGETPKVTTLSTFRPRSTRLTLYRLFMNNPADTRSVIARAICAVARLLRNREAVRAPEGCPV